MLVDGCPLSVERNRKINYVYKVICGFFLQISHISIGNIQTDNLISYVILLVKLKSNNEANFYGSRIIVINKGRTNH